MGGLGDNDGGGRHGAAARGMRARFEPHELGQSDPHTRARTSRLTLGPDPGRSGGIESASGPQSSPRGQAGVQQKVKKVWDPWAEPEPIFGPREIRHALSPRPGTPPFGNVAVPCPPRARGQPGEQSAPGGLEALTEAVRVEIGLEHCGRWTCGLCARASEEALEVALGTRSVGTRDFLVAGRRVRLLVTPRLSQPFALQARVICVEPPPEPDGAVLVELAIDTQDPAALSRWGALVGGRR